KVRDSHGGRDPENGEPADVKRMPHVFVEHRRAEFQGRVFAATKMQPHLAKAEEVEVIDEISAGEKQSPAQRVKRVEHRLAGLIVHSPDRAAHWLPEREKRDEREAGK